MDQASLSDKDAGSSSLSLQGGPCLHRCLRVMTLPPSYEKEEENIASPSTYLLSVLAQLYLGGEQGEGAGRFPPGRLTGWHLEGGRVMDRHTEREQVRQQGGGGSGSGFSDVREEERMEAGVVCPGTGISWVSEFRFPATHMQSAPAPFPPGCGTLACCSHWPEMSPNHTHAQLQAPPAPLTNTIFRALYAIPLCLETMDGFLRPGNKSAK